MHECTDCETLIDLCLLVTYACLFSVCMCVRACVRVTSNLVKSSANIIITLMSEY